MSAAQLREAGLDSQEQARPSSSDLYASGEDHQAVCAVSELKLSDECKLVDQEELEGVARVQCATNYPVGLRRDFATRTKGGRSDIRGGESEEEDEIHSQVWQSLDNLEVAIAATWQDFVELSACVASGKSLMRSFGRLIAWIRRAASLENPPGGSWQTDLPTLFQKVSETRRLLSSTIEFLDTAKKMVECHNARKTIEDAIEDAQEAAEIDDFAEADFSYCRLMAGTMTCSGL
jgi:hypothetical protein